jgi:ubiquitin carboxyl-terminal hydrolase 4/11/15
MLESALENASEVYLAINFSTEVKNRLFDDEAMEKFKVPREQKPGRKANCSLGDCLDLFTKTEKLSHDDPWYCKKCKEHQQASKKLDLWKMPEILVVHLKRFSYSRIWRDKIAMDVDFPLQNLDLSQWIKSNQKSTAVYDLYAVSVRINSLLYLESFWRTRRRALYCYRYK